MLLIAHLLVLEYDVVVMSAVTTYGRSQYHLSRSPPASSEFYRFIVTTLLAFPV
jgi:hypothetical protein